MVQSSPRKERHTKPEDHKSVPDIAAVDIRPVKSANNHQHANPLYIHVHISSKTRRITLQMQKQNLSVKVIIPKYVHVQAQHQLSDNILMGIDLLCLCPKRQSTQGPTICFHPKRAKSASFLLSIEYLSQQFLALLSREILAPLKLSLRAMPIHVIRPRCFNF